MAMAVTIRSTGLARIPKQKIKTPDAIIGATAQVLGRIIITRNPADFPGTPRAPYKVTYQKDASGKITGWLVSDVATAPT
jgi:hypothetical protein